MLHILLPSYRAALPLAINALFFNESPVREEILEILRYGLKGEWTTTLPQPWGPIENYFTPDVFGKCRERFQSELKKGRMIGGPGWTREVVHAFLGTSFYVIPCGAVPKGTDPHGRIIHDYSFAPAGGVSINSCLIDNSVRYITFIERVRALSQVEWYFAVDLENGYRQLPVHPSD